jgi:hypothetical protein
MIPSLVTFTGNARRIAADQWRHSRVGVSFKFAGCVACRPHVLAVTVFGESSLAFKFSVDNLNKRKLVAVTAARESSNLKGRAARARRKVLVADFFFGTHAPQGTIPSEFPTVGVCQKKPPPTGPVEVRRLLL